MYLSDLFQKASAYASSMGFEWYILSAKYGLLDPLQVISPYDMALEDMPKKARQAWSGQVLSATPLQAPRHTVFLASGLYGEFLLPALEALGFTVDAPFKGMGIGDQKSWLNAHTRPDLKGFFRV
jgi:hypothetical protein